MFPFSSSLKFVISCAEGLHFVLIGQDEIVQVIPFHRREMRLIWPLRGKKVGMYMYSTQYIVERIGVYVIDNELCSKKNPSANNVNVKEGRYMLERKRRVMKVKVVELNSTVLTSASFLWRRSTWQHGRS